MNSAGEQPYEGDPISGTMMAELFQAIGFEVTDEDSYNMLAEYVEISGERSRIHRGEATLHGRCWKIGGGLEVWSILYERRSDLYYADCRPAFRGRYVHTIQPWELVEYDEDGEAIVRGNLFNGTDVVFELQNLTELSGCVFREPQLNVTLSGLAYAAQISPSQELDYRFEPTDQRFVESACENDYLINGRVLAWREMRNPITSSHLIWLYIDAGRARIEVLTNRRALRGRLRQGAIISANVWLQGHILEAAEISARYEGVDKEYEAGDFWAKLRRGN